MSNVVESTLSPGSLFQWLITLIVNNFPLGSNCNLIRATFIHYPSSFHVGPCKKGLSMYIVDTLKYWLMMRRTTLSLFFSRLNKPSPLSISHSFEYTCGLNLLSYTAPANLTILAFCLCARLIRAGMEKVQWSYTDTKQQLPNDGPWVTLSQSDLSASIHSNSQAKVVYLASALAGQAPLNLI